MKRSIPVLFAAGIALSSCTDDSAVRKAISTITPDELRNYTMTLGSDSFMGRKPFTEGEKITTEYLAGELKNIGFEPAFGDSWFQEVPMVEISSAVEGPVVLNIGKEKLELVTPDDAAVWSNARRERVSLRDIPMVFCGFGIVAPEYGWNDYENTDVRGKCAVVLINDPGLYTGDTSLFRGRTMTYYGRWTYKFEEAARQGAAAVLIIHETTGAGYNYSIPRKSSITSRLYMNDLTDTRRDCEMTGWLSGPTADTIFGKLGYNIADLREKACNRGYTGFDMHTRLSVDISNIMRYDSSVNVAGILRGSSKPDECVVVSAHWDHFGIGEKENGDSIYNGAVDNGTTMAWAFEIGEAFSAMRRRPDRSVILFFPTAEEEGLLGSYYFTAHPSLPAENILACFNNDMLLAMGRMKDMMVTGYGQSDLEDILADVVRKQNRYILPDPTPETGMYFRSDHFPFARIGVPALFARGNCDSREHGKEWASAREQDFLKNYYHKPADNYYPEMNFEGIAEDASAVFEVAFRVATGEKRPSWKRGSEFADMRAVN